MNAVDMRRIDQTGTIGEAGAGAVLRSIESERATCRVWFETEIGVGQVAFHEGTIVVAEVGPLRRRSALLRILGLTEGNYSVEHTAVPAGAPIVQSIEVALSTLTDRQNEWRQLCESTPPMGAVLRLTAAGRDTKRKAKGAERLVYLLVDGRRSLMEILSEATVDPIEALRIVVRGESEGHFEQASLPSATISPLGTEEQSGEVPRRLPGPPSIPRIGDGSTQNAAPALATSDDLILRKSTLVGLGTECSSSAPPPRSSMDSVDMSPIIDVAGDGSPVESTRAAGTVEPVPVVRRVLGGVSSSPIRSAPIHEPQPPSEPADSLVGTDLPVPEPVAVEPRNRARYVGRYEILHRIGRGGMGSVYLSRLTAEGGFRRLFALKLLRSYLAKDSEAAEAFLGEARLAGQLHHTNVVGVVDAGVHRGQPFLVMDYVEGCSLKQLISTGAECPARIIVPVILEALSGLQALHSLTGDDGLPLDVVHCDISPENLLIGTDGVCRLTDFGVARRPRIDGGQSTHGKPGYLAPEQVTGGTIDRRVDIFAMGVVLWTALVGERLFQGATVEDTLQRVCAQPILPPSTVGTHPPKAFDAVVLKALERDPARRFESAEAMHMALREAAAREGYIALHSEVAAYVRKVVGSELAQRRLLVLDATRPPASTIPPGELDVRQLSAMRNIDEGIPASQRDPSSSHADIGDDGDGHTIPLATVSEGGSKVALLVAGILAAAAVVLAILWPSALTNLFRVNVDRGPLSSESIQVRVNPSADDEALTAPSTSVGSPTIIMPLSSSVPVPIEVKPVQESKKPPTAEVRGK